MISYLKKNITKIIYEFSDEGNGKLNRKLSFDNSFIQNKVSTYNNYELRMQSLRHFESCAKISYGKIKILHTTIA